MNLLAKALENIDGEKVLSSLGVFLTEFLSLSTIMTKNRVVLN